MKKIVSLIVCAAMVFAVAACSSSPEVTKSGNSKGNDPAVTEESKNAYSADDTKTGEKVSFRTTDRAGQSYDDSIFAEHELTLINFWEPWCGPCVGEIPDLQQLYSDYSGKGLLILGVYSETGMESDVDEILSSSNVTYPVLKYSSDFDKYDSGYVPTTILVDKNGNIIDTGYSYDGLDSTLIVGSKSYSEWESLIKKYLGN